MFTNNASTEAMFTNARRKFQSDNKLTVLKIHSAWTAMENVILVPFDWLARQFDQTYLFEQTATVRHLTVAVDK